MKKIVLFVLFGVLAFAHSLKPVMIYDSEILDDKSWNAMIHEGIKRFSGRFGIGVREVMILDVSNFSAQVKALAEEGYDPIMVNNVDSIKQKAIKEIVLAYPKKRFIIFNGSFDIPNADFFIFAYHEATFLAGYLAAKTSKTGKIGFVGGMEVPIIKDFLCGYIQGAKHANPAIEVMYTFIGDDFNAWNNAPKGYALALEQIQQGADVVFGPAGGSSVGVLQAAHEQGKLGIGVDSNQNHLFSGSVLTSVVVRVDNAAYMALAAAQRGIWQNQVKVMGLQEKGVDLAYDAHNEALISPSLRKEVEHIRSEIILGKISLTHYAQRGVCTVNGKELF